MQTQIYDSHLVQIYGSGLRVAFFILFEVMVGIESASCTDGEPGFRAAPPLASERLGFRIAAQCQLPSEIRKEVDDPS